MRVACGLAQLRGACLGIRCFVGCALIIPMIIQTIRLDPSGAVWTDGASNVSRPNPSGAVWSDGASTLSSLDPSGGDRSDAEHPTRKRKVGGSTPPLTTNNYRVDQRKHG